MTWGDLGEPSGEPSGTLGEPSGDLGRPRVELGGSQKDHLGRPREARGKGESQEDQEDSGGAKRGVFGLLFVFWGVFFGVVPGPCFGHSVL